VRFWHRTLEAAGSITFGRHVHFLIQIRHLESVVESYQLVYIWVNRGGGVGVPGRVQVFKGGVSTFFWAAFMRFLIYHRNP
jgi:hypothetical protein